MAHTEFDADDITDVSGMESTGSLLDMQEVLKNATSLASLLINAQKVSSVNDDGSIIKYAHNNSKNDMSSNIDDNLLRTESSPLIAVSSTHSNNGKSVSATFKDER
jgi:3-methyladenine DNA glycosylase Tag